MANPTTRSFWSTTTQIMVGQAGELVQDGVGVVEHGEYLLGPALDVLGLAGHDNRHAVLLAYDLVVGDEFLGHGLGHQQPALYPVHFLAESQLLEMYAVVGEIIKSGYRRLPVEALHQQSLLVHVGEAPRPVHGLQPLLAAPFGHGINQCLSDLDVVYHVQPSEADILLVPVGVGVVVDDAGDASYYLSVLVCQPVTALAVSKSRVGLPQRVHLVRVQGRNVERVVLIQFTWKSNEAFQVFEGKHLFDNYTHTLARVVLVPQNYDIIFKNEYI